MMETLKERSSEPKVSARIKLILTNMRDFWEACTSGDFPSGLEGFMDIDWQGRTVVIRGDVDLICEVVEYLQSRGVVGIR